MPVLQSPSNMLISDFFRPEPDKKREEKEEKILASKLPCVLPECKLRFSTPAARTLHVKHKHPSVPLPIPKDVNTLKNKRYRPTYGKKGRALGLLREGFFHFCFTPEGKGINQVARLVGVSHSMISRWSRKVTAEKILANAAHCETSKGKSKGSGRTPAHPKVVFACGFVVFRFCSFRP